MLDPMTNLILSVDPTAPSFIIKLDIARLNLALTIEIHNKFP
jgi:hypothetical protein